MGRDRERDFLFHIQLDRVISPAMQNGQAQAESPVSSGAGAMPVRSASYPSPISASSPTTYQRSHSQSWPQPHPYSYSHGAFMASPGVDGLPTTRMQAPIHASTLPQAYQDLLQRQQQQQQLVQGFDPHTQHVIAHAQLAPPPPLSSSHPKPRPPAPAQLQTNLQQQQQAQHQQHQQHQMTHTPNTPVCPSPTLAQARALPPPGPPPPVLGGPSPLSMQMAAPTRLREQVQAQAVPVSSQMQMQAAAVAGASVDAAASVSASAGSAATAVPTTPGSAPGTQSRAPPRSLQTYALSPVSARPQSTLPPSSASNTPPSSSSQQQQQLQQQQQQQQQRQHQHQRYAVPPAIAAFKVLQPAKDLLEQTWAAAIAGVQQEFALAQADLSRSVHEKQALAELLQRIQAERVQTVHALRNSQNELRQCTFVPVLFSLGRCVDRGWCIGIVNFQTERRERVHLERKLAEMMQVRPSRAPPRARVDSPAWQFMDKCTCGAAASKISPVASATSTPPPQVVLDGTPPALPSSASSPASAPALAPKVESRPCTPTPAPGPGPDSSSSSSSSSPTPDTTRSSVRRQHERDDDETENAECKSSPKRRRIERSPTPTAPASAPEVVDTREKTGVDKTPTAQLTELPAPQKQPTTPEVVPPSPLQQQQHRPEDPKTPPRRKIGIQHIQLVYETVASTLQCRMCLYVRRPLLSLPP